METPTPAAGSSPATTPEIPAAPAIPTPAPAAPVQTTPTASTTPTARDVAGALSAEDRKAIVTGKTTLAAVLQANGAKPAVAPTAPAQAPTPAASTEPAATPDETPATPEAGEEAGRSPDRFRFKDAADQAVALIAKTKGVSLIEASRIYAADKPNAAPVATTTPTAPETPAVDTEVARYDTRLAELDASLKKLSDARKAARDDVDMEKADSLSDQIADVRTDIGLLKNERQGFVRNRETAVARTYEQQANASRDSVIATYTELQAEGSLHRLALDAYVDRALKDPKRAAEFRDPAWPAKLGEEFAAAHGLKKAGATPATPGSVPAKPTSTPPAVPAAHALRPKPVQVPGARLLSSSDGFTPSGSAAPANATEVLAALKSMTPAERAVLRRAIPNAATR